MFFSRDFSIVIIIIIREFNSYLIPLMAVLLPGKTINASFKKCFIVLFLRLPALNKREN